MCMCVFKKTAMEKFLNKTHKCSSFKNVFKAELLVSLRPAVQSFPFVQAKTLDHP